MRGRKQRGAVEVYFIVWEISQGMAAAGRCFSDTPLKCLRF
jgi:hypothetical protein